MTTLPSSSPVLPRFRLWSPLASDEASLVAKTILEIKNQLEQVEYDIQSLKSELQMLESRKKALHEDLLTHQALMAPIRTLPLEILSEIFGLLCTGINIGYAVEEKRVYVDRNRDDLEYALIGVTTLKVPPVVLSHVCSTWNYLVNHSSFMWSKVSLRLGIMQATDYSDMQRAEKALACVLSRSKNVPLHVSLTWLQDTEDVREKAPELDSILPYFFDQSYRWKTADLAIGSVIEGSLVVQLCRPMPILEELSFSLDTLPEEPEVDHFFCQTPSLQTATFSSSLALSRSKLLGARLHTLVVDIKWSEILPSVSHVKGLLSQCKSLQTLSWDAPLDNTGSSDNECPIVLPITSLSGGVKIDHLLPHVLLPNIKAFDLKIPVPKSSDGTVLSDIQEKYRSLITSLSFFPSYQHWERSTRTMFAQLGSFPQLHTLRLFHYGKQGSPCSFTEIPHRFPRLKTFSYKLWASEPVFDDVIDLLVAFQRSTDGTDGSPLRKVSMLQKVELLLPFTHLSPKQRLRLRDLQNTGLLIDVQARGRQGVLEDVSCAQLDA